jgi:hypothetical protein
MANEWVRRNKWIFVVGPLAGVLLVGIFGEVVMHLWNWLLPPLFGWRVISLWQALGLLLLSRIFFGGWGGGSNQGKGRRRENWARMSSEDREKFRAEMRRRCGGFGVREEKETV